MAFCKEFNAATQKQAGDILPVVITVYKDKSFTFITKSPPAAILLKKAANIAAGSKEPNKTKVGKVTRKQVMDIREYQAQRPERAQRRSRFPHRSPARPARWAWKSSIRRNCGFLRISRIGERTCLRAGFGVLAETNFTERQENLASALDIPTAATQLVHFRFSRRNRGTCGG